MKNHHSRGEPEMHIGNMDIWVKSLFLAQDLGTSSNSGRFTDYKKHTAFEVDDQIVEATVASSS